ncbi:hypothetical protein L2E82_50267 [Cichorium intybus]|nr:hypothetical protein L2E82_50267 [Cichorium intybus]
MGKASNFFKSLLGFRTTEAPATQSARSESKQPKRRWSFVKSHRETPRRLRATSKSVDETSLHHYHRNRTDNEDPNKHAIALAAATAAVVDAAVAAAQAAAEVVRITSRTTGYGAREDLAAVKIQSCFRAYLARRALKALKALVKLQAVVRGHILRKQTADMMRRLQALLRAQARARALRSHFSDSTTKPSSNFHHHGPPTPEKSEHFPRNKHDYRSTSKRNNSKSYASTDHEYDKIVEIDTGGHIITSKGKKFFQPDQIIFGHSQSLTTSRGSTVQPTTSRGSTGQPTGSSPCASCEVNSFTSEAASRSCVSGYSDHPNYMANTESSRAKVRSLSAPRLRGQNEVSNVTKRDYGSGVQWVTTVHDSYTRKAYSGSGRLDRLGMPIYDMDESEYCARYWN